MVDDARGRLRDEMHRLHLLNAGVVALAEDFDIERCAIEDSSGEDDANEGEMDSLRVVEEVGRQKGDNGEKELAGDEEGFGLQAARVELFRGMKELPSPYVLEHCTREGVLRVTREPSK